eukprot:5993518-Alexandrium_andersonii.AAC.1
MKGLVAKIKAPKDTPRKRKAGADIDSDEGPENTHKKAKGEGEDDDDDEDMDQEEMGDDWLDDVDINRKARSLNRDVQKCIAEAKAAIQ